MDCIVLLDFAPTTSLDYIIIAGVVLVPLTLIARSKKFKSKLFSRKRETALNEGHPYNVEIAAVQGGQVCTHSSLPSL